MSDFIVNQSVPDDFVLTSAHTRDLLLINTLTLTQASSVTLLEEGQYYGTQVWIFDATNAQAFLSGQASTGTLVPPGLDHLTLQPGTYYFGAYYNSTLAGEALASGAEDRGFFEAAAVSLPGAVATGGAPLATFGGDEAWRSTGFTVTGNSSLYLEADASGGKFVIMTDAQFQAFNVAAENGFTGQAFSYVDTLAPNGGAPATQISSQITLAPGAYDLVWINDTATWQGGAADIYSYSSGVNTGSVSTTVAGGVGGHGQGLSILGSGTVDGGILGDTLSSTSDGATMRGLDGNDSILGGSGDDCINGNQGSDTVDGGPGADWVLGGQGNDTVYGGDGDDPHVNGNLGDDVVHGGNGNDTVYGGQGNDTIYGDAGNDSLSGDLGNDVMFGGPGADRFGFAPGGGQDWIGDFNAAEGDNIVLPTGTQYTVVNYGGQAMIELASGDTLGLAGVPYASFSASWVTFA